MSYLRIAAAVGAVLLFAFLAWRVSLSFSQGETIEAQAEQISTLEAARLRDTRVAREMSAFRAEADAGRRQFLDELAKKPLTNTVTYVDKASGKEVTCTRRDAARYRELFNRAVTGSADLP